MGKMKVIIKQSPTHKKTWVKEREETNKINRFCFFICLSLFKTGQLTVISVRFEQPIFIYILH